MESTLLAIVDDFKNFVMSGVQTLPLSMAGTLLILGVGTANYSMLFFLVGMLLAAPLLPCLINLGATKDWEMPGCDIIPGNTSYIIPQWIVMVYFFLGYMMTNAIELYQMPPTEPADPQKTTLRKTQCMVGIIAVIVCMFVFGVIRLTSCDTTGTRIGIAIGTAALASVAGYGWYSLLNTSMSGRLADLFGIANRLLSPSAFVNEPVGCVPMA
jgi:hypothetical protein